MAGPDDYDIRYYWDPVCPFAWITSRWVTKVVEQRDYRVDWRFISLRIINKNVDYDAHFPPEYEQGHTAGLRLLRLAAQIQAEHGRGVMGPLYTAFGESIWNSDPSVLEGRSRAEVLGNHDRTEELLGQAGLPSDLAGAASDSTFSASSSRATCCPPTSSESRSTDGSPRTFTSLRGPYSPTWCWRTRSTERHRRRSRRFSRR